MLRRTTLVLSIVVALSNCATPATSSSPQGPRRDVNVITSEELAQTPEGDLYGAIKRLRPSFFATRGVTSPGVGTVPEVIQVYIDGSRASLDGLSQIRPAEVKEVRRLSSSEATQRYGTNHTMGALVVTRK
jgi:hypothetical protein